MRISEDIDKISRELRPEYVCPETGNSYIGEWFGDVKDG